MREYYFLIIPEKGESVRSLMNYGTPQEAEKTGRDVAVLILKKKPDTVRAPLQPIVEAKQKYVNVVVVHQPSKESLSDKRIRA